MIVDAHRWFLSQSTKQMLDEAQQMIDVVQQMIDVVQQMIVEAQH